jgi:opacity protein-like surface antigen
MRFSICVIAAAVVSLAVTPNRARGQELADFDYENLSMRGFGFEWSYGYPSRLERTEGYGLRVDMGYLGPGLRIVPSVTYWKSPFQAAEIEELEARVAGLVQGQTGGVAPSVDLGTIHWSDVAVGVDAHVMWSIPWGFLSFGGLGIAAHVMNGDGAAINGTFIEDLLDSVAAGFNLHAGLEYPVSSRFRINGQGRYEVLGDLQYFQTRFGAQIMIGDNAPGEGPGR